MFDFNEGYGRRAGNKIGGGRYLCTAVLLAFILSISFFSFACGGGGSTGNPTPGPGNGNPGDQNPQQPSAVTISFGSFSYSASEGGSVVITVTLSAGLERSVTIPLVVDTQSTAAAGDYSGLQGVTFASGETTKSITLTITDDTENEQSETVILGFGTLPQGVSAGTTSSTTVTIADNDAPPSQAPSVTVSFGSFSYSAQEGQAAVITVTLSGAPGRTVVVPFTVAGTAQAGDYTGVPASVTFAGGETLKSFTLTTTDDTADEQNETVIFAFGALPQGVSAGTTSSTTVTIIDNDDPPPSQTPSVTVSFGAASHSIMEAGAAVITVTLSGDPGRTVVVPFTVTGTAQAGDYTLQPPTGVTFTSGQTTKNITLTATDDTADEQNETVILGFGTFPQGVTAGTISSTTVTIIDNDDPPRPDSCDDDEVISVTGNYDARTAEPDPDPQGEGLHIQGNDLRNIIRGGRGDDCIRSGGGNDWLEGRRGDDLLEGGPGTDTAFYQIDEGDNIPLEGLDISLADGTATNDGYGDTDTLTNIENIECIGTLGTDTAQGARIVGDNGNNLLRGCQSFAEDLLIGQGGDDLFVQTAGEDYLDGGEGADTLDLVPVGYAGSIDLSLVETGNFTPSKDNTGNYGKIADYTDPLGWPYATYAKLESGSKTTAGEGETTIENIIGSGAADTLTGDADDNRLDGKGGNDTLTGKGGADTLIGGTGTDTLAGGPGDDTYHADSSDTITEAADAGDDTVYYTGTSGITHGVNYEDIDDGTTPANVETIYGTGHNDTIRAADIASPTANDEIRITGGPGDDTLIGGAGNNVLIGCGGTNTYYSNVGGPGFTDSPYASPGSGGETWVNVFVVSPRTSATGITDTIRDFSSTDQLVLVSRDNVTVTKTSETEVRVVAGNSRVSIRPSGSPDLTADELKAALESATGNTLVINSSYDTGCDQF